MLLLLLLCGSNEKQKTSRFMETLGARDEFGVLGSIEGHRIKTAKDRTIQDSEENLCQRHHFTSKLP